MRGLETVFRRILNHEMLIVDTTLKDASFDKTNNVYMVDSEILCCNFDKVVKRYSSKKHLPKQPSSCDALCDSAFENRYFLIEFKNGSSNEKNLTRKFEDSIYILNDINAASKETIQKCFEYIVCINEEYLNKHTNLQENYKYFSSFSNKNPDRYYLFNLRELLKGQVSAVHTYTVDEFYLNVVSKL